MPAEAVKGDEKSFRNAADSKTIQYGGQRPQTAQTANAADRNSGKSPETGKYRISLARQEKGNRIRRVIFRLGRPPALQKKF